MDVAFALAFPKAVLDYSGLHLNVGKRSAS